MNKKIIGISILIIVITIAISGCTSQENEITDTNSQNTDSLDSNNDSNNKPTTLEDGDELYGEITSNSKLKIYYTKPQASNFYIGSISSSDRLYETKIYGGSTININLSDINWNKLEDAQNTEKSLDSLTVDINKLFKKALKKTKKNKVDISWTDTLSGYSYSDSENRLGRFRSTYGGKLKGIKGTERGSGTDLVRDAQHKNMPNETYSYELNKDTLTITYTLPQGYGYSTKTERNILDKKADDEKDNELELTLETTYNNITYHLTIDGIKVKYKKI